MRIFEGVRKLFGRGGRGTYHDHRDGDQNPIATFVSSFQLAATLVILTIAGDLYGWSEQGLVPWLLSIHVLLLTMSVIGGR